MKKAVIQVGGSQYVVTEGDEITVNLLNSDKKTVELDVLMIVDGKSSKVGAPTVKGASVKATVVEADTKDDKVLAIRYKSKKRVHKIRGHRQRITKLKISSITS